MKKYFENKENLSFKVELPKNRTETCVILIPGVSGKVFEIRLYSLLSDAIQSSNMACVRFNFWKSRENLESLSLSEIIEFLDNLISKLKSMNFKKIHIVGKSFGGMIALLNKNDLLGKKVLLAPALAVKDISNLNAMKNKKFSEIKSIFDFNISENELDKKSQTLIIHGTSDLTVPIENSEMLLKKLPNASLINIAEADHSYNGREKEVAREIIRFLI